MMAIEKGVGSLKLTLREGEYVEIGGIVRVYSMNKHETRIVIEAPVEVKIDRRTAKVLRDRPDVVDRRKKRGASSAE